MAPGLEMRASDIPDRSGYQFDGFIRALGRRECSNTAYNGLEQSQLGR